MTTTSDHDRGSCALVVLGRDVDPHAVDPATHEPGAVRVGGERFRWAGSGSGGVLASGQEARSGGSVGADRLVEADAALAEEAVQFGLVQGFLVGSGLGSFGGSGGAGAGGLLG
ncbi:hypothetical protein BC793_104238 [Actinoplanes xinjiangensis]|uniref:Uncharacterized protein n=1 Tax=Actinoplanes xinjiangensis TaxID=512350 RepID=A0A316FLH1_9ACTN|nr:hypothetical protein BC793_104238 [Actinoplanes xinjiangensis]